VNNKVVIVIRDTGSGIKEEHIDRLFEPFFTTKVTGVGLGLAVVKKIINDHDGEITVRNRPEGGTEFKIEFVVPGSDSAEQ
ncbi:MAG: ATP-binding protein, partial [Spirochaetota bacterium]